MSETDFEQVDVEAIMREIRSEIAKHKSADAGTPTTAVKWSECLDTVIPGSYERKSYSIARKVGRGLKKLGFHGLVRVVKTLVPESLKKSSHFTPDEFTKYHDDEFIEKAYRGILQREPDVPGLNSYLAKLRSGELSKIEILGRLRYSSEGKAKNIRIRGLRFPFLVNTAYKIPAAGYLLRLATCIPRLPVILKNIHEFEAFTSAGFTAKERRLKQLSSRFEDDIRQLTHRVDSKTDLSAVDVLIKEMANKIEIRFLDQIRAGLANKADLQAIKEVKSNLAAKADIALIEAVREMLQEKAQSHALDELRSQVAAKADAELLEDTRKELAHKLDAHALDSLKAELAQKAESQALDEMRNDLVSKAEWFRIENEVHTLLMEIKHHKASILSQQRSLMLLVEEARKRLPEPLSREQIQNMVKEGDHFLDAMYVAFEDEFRGTRREIKERQKIYLTYIEKTEAGKDGVSVLDLGCGRGEWLELLKEKGYAGKGVDFNRVMVQQCRDLGFDVAESDMFEFLREQKQDTFSGVTGFQIVEHLPLRDLITFFDESLRVLRPGGIAIFESPNPENLIVGVCNFYFDPTHRNPIPPKLLGFLLEARGFIRVEIIRLHPYQFLWEGSNPSEEMKQIKNLFNMEADYAVIGWKA